MATVTIYHNPRCSKSRQTLALLEENNVEPRIVPYLDEPPDEATLKKIIAMLGVNAIEIVRTGEDAYKEADIDKDSSEDEIVAAIVKAPKLLQRPIVVSGKKAAIGRPPENVLAIL